MSKSYQVIVNFELDSLIRKRQFEYLILIYSWLIDGLYKVLGDKLNGIEIEVIRFVHHSPTNAYPAIGIHYTKGLENSVDVEQIVTDEMTRMLENRTIMDLVNFMENNDTNWNHLAEDIMESSK